MKRLTRMPVLLYRMMAVIAVIWMAYFPLHATDECFETTTQEATICQGDSIRVGDNVYTTTGVYTDTLPGGDNCDTIITTNLTVLPVFTFEQFPVICQGDSVKVGNSVYKTPGTYRDTLKTISNCDSIIITQLTVRPVAIFQQAPVICQGDSIQVGNKVYKVSGNYVDTLKTVFNCDSVIFTSLTVRPVFTFEQFPVICQGDSVEVGNSVYTTTGTYRDTLKTISNCDSIIITQLTVRPVAIFQQAPVICQGDSIRVGNKVYKVSGNYVDTLKTVFNCDSVIFTSLTVRPVFTFEQFPVICQGDSVKVGNKVYQQSGVYRDTLKTIFNCDSIIITTLTVNPVFNQTNTVSICSGTSYTVGNNTYTVSGIYRDTLRTFRNCDSIITTQLTVLDAVTFSQNIFICEGQSYTIGNNSYSVTGIYRDTFPASGGCDSIVITNLTVGNLVNVATQASICAGEIFQFGDTILLTAGVYTRTFTGTSGCDSIITLTLTVHPVKETTLNRTACQGDTIVIRGVPYTQSGTVRFTEKTFQGCDSIITYVLVFNRKDNITQNRVVCVPGNFEGIPVNRDTVIVKRLKNIFNCDSIVTVQIRAAYPDTVAADTGICFGTVYQGITIRRDTVITRKLTNADGCDSLVTESITVLPLPVLTVSRDTTINPGSSVSLFASGAVTYQWSTGQQGAAIIVSPLQSTVYTVTGTAENGCSVTAQIRVDVNPCKVEVPTLFTPNGDGIHDQLVIKGVECLADFRLTILNRWGNILFETEDITEKWDGTYNGTNVSEGVYYYVISARIASNNTPVLEKGYVHVKR